MQLSSWRQLSAAHWGRNARHLTNWEDVAWCYFDYLEGELLLVMSGDVAELLINSTRCRCGIAGVARVASIEARTGRLALRYVLRLLLQAGGCMERAARHGPGGPDLQRG